MPRIQNAAIIALWALWLATSGVAWPDSETLLKLLEQPVSRYLLSETDEGASIVNRVLGHPLSSANMSEDLALLDERLETLRSNSPLTNEIETRLARIQSLMGETGETLTTAEENRLGLLAREELTVDFVDPISRPPNLERRFLRADPLPELTLGREFSALADPSITPKKILTLIQAQRGGEIAADTLPGKWILKDSEGLKWGAEVDGKLPGRGGIVNVLEVQTPPLNGNQGDLVDLPLKALLEAGAEPTYSVGGGHIHIDLERYLLSRPIRFASLVNYLLNYEELLNYVFANPGRAHATQKLSAKMIEGATETMSEFLGKSLNQRLAGGDPDRIMKTLKDFATDVVGSRDVDINLRSWQGSGSKKTHGTLELRLFNTPKLSREAILEDRLVRSIVARAAASDADPILYAPLTTRLEGEATYYDDARLEKDFRQMTDELGLDFDEYNEVFLRRLSERRHPGN